MCTQSRKIEASGAFLEPFFFFLVCLTGQIISVLKGVTAQYTGTTFHNMHSNSHSCHMGNCVDGLHQSHKIKEAQN